MLGQVSQIKYKKVQQSDLFPLFFWRLIKDELLVGISYDPLLGLLSLLLSPPFQSVNRSIWTTTPAVVNAYYSRNRNQISMIMINTFYSKIKAYSFFLILVFPAGILQPPFYHKESLLTSTKNNFDTFDQCLASSKLLFLLLLLFNEM